LITDYPDNETYVILPIGKTLEYIKADTSAARLSVDKQFLVWHGHEIKKALPEISLDDTIITLTHKEALEITQTVVWIKPDAV
jgi:hypothetical protein